MLGRFVSFLRGLREALQRQEAATREISATVQSLGVTLDHLVAQQHAVGHDMRRLRETANLAARRVAPTTAPYRVVFLVHNVDVWDSWAALFDLMEVSDDFDPIVITIPRRFGGRGEYSDEEVNHQGLRKAGVAHLRFDFIDPHRGLHHLKQLNPDVIFRQSQWELDVQAGFHADELAFTRLAYIPYELLNVIENVPGPDGTDSATDEPLLRWAWRVFCTNELMRLRAARGSLFQAKGWVVTGHPKVNRIRSASPVWPLGSDSAESRRSRVVYSAHHSIGDDWIAFGMFPLIADQLLNWAASAPDIDFVFSAHPALDTALRENPPFAAIASRFRGSWDSLPNTSVIGTGESYLPTLAAADVLLTDGLSVLIEGQVLGVPVVWLEREGHRPFNEIGDITLAGVHTVNSFEAARRVVADLITGEDSLADSQAATVRQLLGENDPARRILDNLRSGLEIEALPTRK